MSHYSKGNVVLTDTKVERRKASELIRHHKPKGIQTVSERALTIARLVAEGRTILEVSHLMSITPGTVHNYLQKVREAAEDAANREENDNG